jgi:hypothetical protein
MQFRLQKERIFIWNGGKERKYNVKPFKNVTVGTVLI